MKAQTVLILVSVTLLGAAVLVVGAWFMATRNFETPDYVTVVNDGDIEIRDYPALAVAEVTRTGDRRSAVNQGFGPLARYIFARDRGGDKISMTAPVTQQKDQKIAMTAPVTQTAEDGTWVIGFIMPAAYSLDALPAPGSGDIALREIPPSRRAAIRFSGVATDETIAHNEAKLREWLRGRGIETTSGPTYAYYNDPFTPGFLRRNEVIFEISGDIS